jgi:isoleucyl-tRNA synthetase
LVVLPLWNAYVFLATYAVADGWSPKPADLEVRPTGDLDRYILSRVERFVAELTLEYERYELSNLIPAFTRLCDDLNNWYIRRGRRRYWRAKNESAAGDRDKQDAYATLLRVLTTLTRAMAPVMPFFTEYLHQRLMVDTGLAPAGDSVHERPFPQADQSLIDLALEQRIETARSAIALGLVIREREKLGVRRPLARVTVASPDPAVRDAVEQLSDALRGELNVKEVVAIADDSALCSLSAKANFKRLGKRLGPKMKAVAAAVEKLDAAAIARLERGESVELEGETLSAEDITLAREALPGNASETEGGVTVVLDTNVTPELAAEGIAREMVSRIQNLRKDLALNVSQQVKLFIAVTTGPVAQMLGNLDLKAMIQSETLSVAQTAPLEQFPAGATVRQESIDGEPVSIGLVLEGP